MVFRRNAPTKIVWVICLVLYLLALAAHFRLFRVERDLATWVWIIGYGLLLVATQLRRV
jgi:hypothetical protein